MTDRRSIGVRKRLAIYTRQNGLCAACGMPMRSGQFEIDHAQALVHGGDDADDNLRAIHVKCHRAKTDEDIRMARKGDRIAAGGKKRKGPGFRGWRRMDGTPVWKL